MTDYKTYQWKYANKTNSTIINDRNGVVYITFPKLSQTGVIHGCSTRIGGVSEGHLGSMNLSFSRGDDPQKVYENYRRMGEAMGFCQDDLVLSAQIHETKIRKVSSQDKGDGILRPTVAGIDALVTNEKNIPMATSFADCVPLLFFDPVEEVIAMAHAGWRGTVAEIGRLTLEYMTKEYDVDPKNVIAAIGPSICRSCYEVSEDVALQFQKLFSQEEIPLIMDDKGNGKYQLDLWKANELILLKAGILKENLDITNLCTCCNHEVLFSHRASHGLRGNLNCIMMIPEGNA